jgi:hypothetical protein
MQSPLPQTSSSPVSFAGFLSALTQPGRAVEDRAPSQTPKWTDELLADDVATLSYERALRAHSRYRADEPTADQAVVEPLARIDADVLSAEASLPVPCAPVPCAPVKVLKDASITIRLSHEEDAQLRMRAGEAGLSVSAYIRSCTFEAEALRALVKDTLTQFRVSGPAPKQDLPVRRRRWSAFFWPGRRGVNDGGQMQA